MYGLPQAIAEAETARLAALAAGQTSAAVAATTLKSKLMGLLVERKEVTQKGPLEETDVDKLQEIKDVVDARLKRALEARQFTNPEPELPMQVHRRRVIG